MSNALRRLCRVVQAGLEQIVSNPMPRRDATPFESTSTVLFT